MHIINAIFASTKIAEKVFFWKWGDGGELSKRVGSVGSVGGVARIEIQKRSSAFA